MLDKLLNFDQQFFILVNNGLANPFFDWICPWIRDQRVWYPMYLVISILFIRLYKKDSWKLFLAVGLMLLCTDQFSSNLVKNTFMRLRPCVEPALEGITRHLISSCNGFSFISAHATNHFALAIFFSYCFRQVKWLLPVLLFWAFSIAFSQVYVGVHYPFDVIAGSLCGILFGFAFSRYVFKYIPLKDA